MYQGLLFLEKPDFKRSLIIGILTVSVSFIHAYYLGFALLIYGCLFLINLIGQRVSLKKALLHFALQVIGSLVIVEGIMALTDSVKDRPSYPWSPFLTNFNLHGVFFPVGKPLGSWIGRNFGMPPVEWESIGYIGMATTLFFFASVLALLVMIFGRRIKSHPFVKGGAQKHFLVLTTFLALVTPALFTALANNEWTYMHMGPIRQFRSIGRFNWVVFSSLNFIFFGWLSGVIQKKKAFITIPLTIVVFAFFINDIYWNCEKPFHENHEHPLLTEGSKAQAEMRNTLQGIDVIIPMPYFHIGSESFVYERGGGEHYLNTMSVSYACGIPITAVMLSRTSLEQTLDNLTYMAFPVTKPEYFEYLKEKSIAVLIKNGEDFKLQEQLILNSTTDVLFEGDGFSIKKLDLNALSSNYTDYKSQHAFGEESLKKGIVFKDYESNTDKSYFGEGALKVKPEAPREVDSFIIPDSLVGAEVKIGVWAYLYEQSKAIEAADIKFINANNEELGSEFFSLRDNLTALDGFWGYSERTVRIHPQTTKIHIVFRENGLYPSPTYIDGLNLSVLEP